MTKINVCLQTHYTEVILLFTQYFDRTFSGVQTVICVRPKELNDYVSGEIYNNGAWEEGEVIQVMKMMDDYPEAVFLDLGSNLG